MKLVVTGATGYIGCHLLSLATKKGYDVIAASRSRPQTSIFAWLPFELSSIKPLLLPQDTMAIIHLAADTTSMEKVVFQAELLAAQALLKASEKVSAKFIYVSSQSARSDGPTAYGRLKWSIEQAVLSSGGCVVRPGQVYGGVEKGLFGTLVRIVMRTPILPAFLPTPKVQPIHVDDLAEGLLRIVAGNDSEARVVFLGSLEPIPFIKFIRAIVSVRARKTRLFIPTPVFLIKFFCCLLGKSLRERFGISRLYSLVDLPAMDTAEDLNVLGLSLRSLSCGMHRSGNHNRRQLIREGSTFLSYLLKRPPSLSLLRRYVNVVEQIRGGRPLYLPRGTYKFPVLLTFIDPQAYMFNGNCNEYVWRLNAAVVLAEATTQGARSFLGLGRHEGFLGSSFGILKALSSELLLRSLRFICSPVIRFWLDKGPEE